MNEMASSPSRILQYIKNDQPFFMISGMTTHPEPKSPEENAALDQKLKTMLKQSGLGYFQQIGSYKGVDEISYVVSSNKLDNADLLKQGLQLGKAFEQDSILFYDGEEARLHYQDGSTDAFNATDFGVDPQAFADADDSYSEFKGKKYIITSPDPDNPNRAGKGHRVARGERNASQPRSLSSRSVA